MEQLDLHWKPFDRAEDSRKRKRASKVHVLTLGDGSVGKSCLIRRFCEGTFQSKYIATIGVDYGRVTLLGPGQQERNESAIVSMLQGAAVAGQGGPSSRSDTPEISAHFWDLAGPRDYSDVRSEFYRDAHAALLVFDVGSRKSFESLGAWVAEAKQCGLPESAPVFLAANKAEGLSTRSVLEAEGRHAWQRATAPESASTRAPSVTAEWRQLFGSPEFLQSLRERALRRGLRGCGLRSVVWRVFLEVLPPYVAVSEWPERMAQLRSQHWGHHAAAAGQGYAEQSARAQRHMPESVETADPAPAWSKSLPGSVELLQDIARDVVRTYPEYEFFQQPRHQEALKRVLFVYAMEHQELRYRQGMNEVLAPLYFLIHAECSAGAEALAAAGASAPDRAIVAALLDPSYVEHDSWATFSAVMLHIGELYAGCSQSCPRIALARSPQRNGCTMPPPGQQGQLTPVVKRCWRIQGVLLKQKDPQLGEYLEALDVQPQLYALRWLRLMFAREFHIQDLMVLWDAIFAYGRSLALVDGIAVSMLEYIREQLLGMDNMGALKRLLKYPPVEDVSVLATKAVELITPGTSASASASTPILTRPPSVSVSYVSQSFPGLRHVKRFSESLRCIIKPDEPRIRQLEMLTRKQQEELENLREQVAKLQVTHVSSAARVEHVVALIQKELTIE
eukprot:m51a1_g13874 hypothetical protein (677) ;mRNA; r:634970-638424